MFQNTAVNIFHYNDVIMSAMASQITSLTIVYSSIYSRADKKNMKTSRHWPLWLEFTGDRWIPRTKGQQRGKMFPFDDVIMWKFCPPNDAHFFSSLVCLRELYPSYRHGHKVSSNDSQQNYSICYFWYWHFKDVRWASCPHKWPAIRMLF